MGDYLVSGKRIQRPPKGRYMKIAVAAVIIQVIGYSWVHLILSYLAGVEIAPTTSIGFYTFCGFEAGVCGWIKTRGGKSE